MRSLFLRNLEHLLIMSFQNLSHHVGKITAVVIRLTKSWKKTVNDYFLIGTVLMDPSKAFKCIPDDSLLSRVHAY